ncbi:tellurite resistance TerB family protein [Candidatus Phycosocius spiralis]|uniref:Tellurite resistance TerB family protein n=1 Tax=Candidatus Phycosocius spiralis TaxID=2815099 RepID=A0ABQ4PVZ6_9PROT|nr:tellurite resistance TerB family protein [Candidatus Phycosocius spiralis]GIU67211.1 hypothetical protein PsB1_1365 [Candidatus Phycosocius spiralis]
MFDANKIFAALQHELPKAIQAIKSEGQAGIDRIRSDQDAKNLALGAGAAGVLGGIFLSGAAGKFGRQAATLGGIAALGTLAYQAYQKHHGRSSQGSTPSDLFLPSTPMAQELVGKATLRAMIAAMKADGHIEAGEKAKLFDHLAKIDLSDAEKSFLFDELAKPLDIQEVVQDATSPEMAAEIYAASLIAINPNGKAEKVYLADLAQRLSLNPDLVVKLHQEVV